MGDILVITKELDEATSFYQEAATIIAADKSFYKNHLKEGNPSLHGLSMSIDRCKNKFEMPIYAVERMSELLRIDGRYSADQRKNSRKKTYSETMPPEAEVRAQSAPPLDYF